MNQKQLDATANGYVRALRRLRVLRDHEVKRAERADRTDPENGPAAARTRAEVYIALTAMSSPPAPGGAG
jgi:hypothetical protein